MDGGTAEERWSEEEICINTHLSVLASDLLVVLPEKGDFDSVRREPSWWISNRSGIVLRIV
jgi:hypothetical protein